MRSYVGFVEDKDHGEFGFVEDRAGIEHVGHKGCRGGGTRGVYDVGNDGRKGRGQGVGDDGAGGRPNEAFNLPGGVD